jgi:hypothetical protein
MKDIQKFWVQGSTGTVQGLVEKLTLTILGIAFAFVLLAPISVKAAGAITQLEYIQWLVQVTGETSQFSVASGSADYVQWAQSKGMTPAGGWRATTKLTREVLAQTLVQLFNLSSQKTSDYERILQREGINLPEATEIDRPLIAQILLFDPTLTPRIPFSGPGSPVRRGNNGVGNGEDPPPPGWIKNHPGREQNDGPGTGPGHPNNKGPKGP